MGRQVSAVVTDGDRCVGTVGPFAVEVRWWAEVEPVVAHLRTVLGVPAYVVRLLRVDGGDGARDGHVTYHVEAPGTAASLSSAPCPPATIRYARTGRPLPGCVSCSTGPPPPSKSR